MTNSADIRKNIELIEEAYEFMLAYAAQGRADEGAGPDGAHIRTFLTQFNDATDSILQAVEEVSSSSPESKAFIEALKVDATTVKSVMTILLGKDNVSSEMVDNANGLISVRSYLTALFFLDKAVLS
ncbi:MAG: hypothetical protein GKS01_11225 [Alphaproteobacteria bacterium]|nr:hypothetical protein [Alphaproteobacteria bacterium]